MKKKRRARGNSIIIFLVKRERTAGDAVATGECAISATPHASNSNKLLKVFLVIIFEAKVRAAFPKFPRSEMRYMLPLTVRDKKI